MIGIEGCHIPIIRPPGGNEASLSTGKAFIHVAICSGIIWVYVRNGIGEHSCGFLKILLASFDE